APRALSEDCYFVYVVWFTSLWSFAGSPPGFGPFASQALSVRFSVVIVHTSTPRSLSIWPWAAPIHTVVVTSTKVAAPVEVRSAVGFTWRVASTNGAATPD